MMEQPLRILVVDDNADFAESQCILLGLHGYSCRSASDVPSGVEVAKQFRPDVILFDLGMPGDGLTVPALIRQVCWPAPAFVAISGYTDAKVRHQLLEDGVYLFLTKPVEPDVLLCVLSTVLIAAVA